MAKLVDHSVPLLLSKGEDWRLGGGVQQKGQEGPWLRPGVLLEDRVKDRMKKYKLSPVCGGLGHRGGQARTLASDEVEQGARGGAGTARHPTHTRLTLTKMAPQPTATMPTREHSGLGGRFLYLVTRASTGGPDG